MTNGAAMTKKRPWDADQIALLKELIDKRISLARASVIFKRSQASVQVQARRLGLLFPGVRATKSALKKSIAEAESRAGIKRD